MFVVMIRTRLRADADLSAYEALNARMEQLLRDIPGFVDVKGYASPDGDELGMVRFETLEALHVWRDLPEHRRAQERGRTEFYAAYRIEVCEVVRAYAFAEGRYVTAPSDTASRSAR